MKPEILSKTEAKNELDAIKKREKELLGIINAKEPEGWESIKTLEDACRKIGKDFDKFKISIKDYSEDTAAYEELKVIVEAINEEKMEEWLEWDNESQYKYYPWMNMRSGSGFSCNHFHHTHSDSLVTSRLCFKSRERMIFATTHFLETYKRYFKQ
jgi:hypothetical protein